MFVVGWDYSDGCTYNSFVPWVVLDDADECAYLILLIEDAQKAHQEKCRQEEIYSDFVFEYRGLTFKADSFHDSNGPHSYELPHLPKP